MREIRLKSAILEDFLGSKIRVRDTFAAHINRVMEKKSSHVIEMLIGKLNSHTQLFWIFQP